MAVVMARSYVRKAVGADWGIKIIVWSLRTGWNPKEGSGWPVWWVHLREVLGEDNFPAKERRGIAGAGAAAAVGWGSWSQFILCRGKWTELQLIVCTGITCCTGDWIGSKAEANVPHGLGAAR